VPAYSTGLTTNLVKGHSPVAVFTAQRFSSLPRGALRAPTRTDENGGRSLDRFEKMEVDLLRIKRPFIGWCS
jgi:hypothetical protein